MIRFTLLVLSFITTLTAAGTVWADGHERPLAADLRRPTMPVSDLEASVKFFTDVLGMEEGGRQVYNSPILRAAMRIPDGVDITVLRLNDRNQIGAMVLVSAPGLIINSDANTANATTLALSTHDINAVYARAVAGGYQVIMSPEEAAAAENYPPEKEMVLVEPSGHRLIVIQPPPAD
jgi:catechol 2,3-dioxygenase-like lactoylglutathione lyase family enzyme